jgi:tellurite resistance protein TehA-like permease
LRQDRVTLPMPEGDVGSGRHHAIVRPAVTVWRRAAELSLPPSSFSIVMATGIVSVAMQEEQRGARSAVELASTVLTSVAAAALAVLATLYGARMLAAAARVRAELAHPSTGFDFFAFVAAVDVLGVRAAGAGRPEIGRALWTIGALAWLVLLLALPLAMAAGSRAATAAAGSPAVAASAVVPTRPRRRAWSAASGNWLLPVVATQSLAVLAGMLARPGRAELEPLLLVALGCWLLGLALYVALLAGIVVRALASPPTGMRFTPDDWIIMGALAISTLAATQLLRAGPGDRLLRPVRPVLTHATGVTWALASAAIVPLAALHLRRLLRDRAARRYQTRWWAGVFPLGMYSVATHQLAVTLHWRRLEPVAGSAAWIALTAWTLTAAAAVGAWLAPRSTSLRPWR